MAEVVTRLGQQETITPPVQATADDATGLVQMILEAARTVRRDKSRCQQLARQVLLIGYLLAKLGSQGVMQDPRVAIPLEGLEDTLRLAYELVESCQYPESAAYRCFSVALCRSRRQAKQFRRLEEEMGDYLRLDPSVRDAVRDANLQEHQLLPCDREVHAPSFNTKVVGRRRQSCWPCKEKYRALSIPRFKFNRHETSSGPLVFHLYQLLAATNNFSPQNEIGRGGFGIVYKGKMKDGMEVAVKRCSLSGSDSDSEKLSQEFRTEVEVLRNIDHRNVVKLIGYCTEKREMILVYEYMPNGSLDKYIYGMRKELVFDWPTRFRIIKGIAQGLSHIHEHCRTPIVHRDIKLSNILLDLDMNPKITDFGTARVLDPGAEEEHTDILLGTVGYLAPEYLIERIYSIKSDIYSFGIVLIEIIAGKRRVLFPQEGHSSYIHEFARELWKEGRSTELMDPQLPTDDHKDEIVRCTKIGLLCIEPNRDDRPSMQDVLRMLDSESGNLGAIWTKRTTRKPLSDYIRINLDTETSTTPLRGE
ncbi:hypothetical protein PVAP13_7NG109123 [Panicum virgatum]|uniref:Protein kinase domain-containing protein n=1 Tax=Panicum virgatum TaxID=38727 RepID=A0A8T0PV08_PANVG|nr:hypothetical protein PVAP13_7NG109123 [Panicum virgatum]